MRFRKRKKDKKPVVILGSTEILDACQKFLEEQGYDFSFAGVSGGRCAIISRKNKSGSIKFEVEMEVNSLLDEEKVKIKSSYRKIDAPFRPSCKK